MPIRPPSWTDLNQPASTETGAIHFVLVRQFRYALGRETLELPGGIVGSGVTPLQAAREELLEETGFVGGEWCLLGSYLANAGLQNNFVHSFFCRNPSQQLGVEPEEGATVQFLPPKDFWQALHGGELCQAFALASALMASEQGLITISR